MEFKVIQGGLTDACTKTEYVFADAHVTDTRLMGVLGLRIHWLCLGSGASASEDIYHYFYYDIEEIGLDNLSVYHSVTEEDVAFDTRSCFGGLGAKMIPLNEKEARFLVQWFIRGTLDKKQPLPENIAQVQFLMSPAVVLTAAEEKALWVKTCTDLESINSLIHYYLMRQFGKDFEGAALLVSSHAKPEDLEDISLPEHAAFLHNTVETVTAEDGSKTYLCESLVEGEKSHYMVLTELTAYRRRITSCRKKSVFPLSISEASMILTRREFVSVFDIMVDLDRFDELFDPYSAGFTVTEHACGELFMEFNPDNSHVEKKVFILSDDVHAVYFVTDYGQMVVAANTIRAAVEAELNLFASPVGGVLMPVNKYQFAQNILYDFVMSGMGDFNEYLSTLK